MRRPSEKGQAKGKHEGLDEAYDHDGEAYGHEGDSYEFEYLPLDSTSSQSRSPPTNSNGDCTSSQASPPINNDSLQQNPPKRPKMIHKKISLSDSNAQEEMERLEAELQKESPDKKFVKKALESTFPQRRNWIEEDCPLVGEILQKYPIFKKSRYVCSYTVQHENITYLHSYR